jgi:hypothetical protein
LWWFGSAIADLAQEPIRPKYPTLRTSSTTEIGRDVMPVTRGHQSLPIMRSSNTVASASSPITHTPISPQHASSEQFSMLMPRSGGSDQMAISSDERRTSCDGDGTMAHDSTHIDITHLLHYPQKEAAKKLGISESMLCKRFKESTPRKWPYRYVCGACRRQPFAGCEMLAVYAYDPTDDNCWHTCL